MNAQRGFRQRAVLSGMVLLLLVAGPVGAAAPNHFRAHLSQEFHDLDTVSQGQAIFRLNSDETQLTYKLIVANLDNTRMAHIHLGQAGALGPIVAWLYPGGPPPMLIEGRFSGGLAEGTITSANLMGPLAGMALADLVTHMRAGNTYVNVHTSAYPAGEIAGQIIVQGP